MLALSLLPVIALLVTAAQAAGAGFGKNIVPYIPQSFFFSWNDETSPLPNPTTAQCDTIQIKWARSTAQGPNPVSPYKLLVHSSSATIPFVIDAGSDLQYNWTVPFPPGTQYEICMFDKNGATGGCQAIYTMYPSQTSSQPSCANSTTLPTNNTLEVDGFVVDGPISRYGWVNQCTDISLVPKNGRPPYTMIVAPALHPPFKIVSNDTSPINWTVSLSWASPFFISLTDADNLAWSNGPLHSGSGSDTCLSSQPASSGVSVGVIAGSTVGGVVFGVIAGIVIASFFARNRYSKVRRNSSTDSIDHAAYINQARFKTTDSAPHASGTGPDMGNNNQYLVEPFMPEGTNPTSPTQNPAPPTSASAYSNPQSDGSGSGTQQTPHVYVVHHDGGGAPVTVFTGGAAVTELPPSYVGRPEDRPLPQPTSSVSNETNPTDRRPRPGPTPRKSQPGNQ